MEDTIEAILVEAARTKQRKESVERAVGRAARRMGKDFSMYIAAMSKLRELASSTKTTVDEALEKLQEREQE